MITLTTGTAFIMWLGEQITERGIGNGISLIIFAGIVAGFPDAVVRTRAEVDVTGDLNAFELFMILGIVIAVIAVDHLLRARAAKDPGAVRASASSDERCTAASRRTCRSR